MSFNRLQIRSSLRQRIEDRIDTSAITTNPPSHFSRAERATPLTGVVLGSTRFKVRHYPLLSKIVGGVEQLIQVIDQAGTAFVVDTANTDYLRGIVAVTVPVGAASKRILVSYFDQWYLDGQLNDFLDEAYKFIMPGANPVADDVTIYNMADNLEPAMLKYAEHLVCKANAKKDADFFNYTAGGKTEDKAEVPKTWLKLAQTALEEARQLRSDVYGGRQDRAKAPAFRIGAPAGLQVPYTPPR